MFYINDMGKQALNKRQDENVRIVIFVIPFFCILTWLLYVATEQFIMAFYLMVLPFIVIYSGFLFVVARNNLKKCNMTITEIERTGNMLTLTTFNTLVFEEKRIEADLANIKLTPAQYNWYIRRKSLDGLTIVVNKQAFYLVKDFFDEYEEVARIAAWNKKTIEY